MRTALYSKPLSVTHGPLGACTLRIAVTMVPTTMVAASGVNAPSVSSAPPSASDDAGGGRVALAGPQPDSLEEAAGALEAVPAEPAEQLLGAVPDEQRAYDAAEGHGADAHEPRAGRRRRLNPHRETPGRCDGATPSSGWAARSSRWR